MAEKERAPFKSGVTDFEAIRRRWVEIGATTLPIGSENGVDVTPRGRLAVRPEPGHYGAGYQ